MDRFSPRAVVFDLDGLMFNTEELYVEVARALLARRGHEVTQPLLDAMMGRPSPISLQTMIDWHQLDATVAQLEQETADVFPGILDQRLSPMPGLLNLLEQIEQRGLPKAIATSSRALFAHDILGRFELLPRFQFVLTCESITQGKPHPEIYCLAAERLGVATQEMLVLEDSATGCRAAVASGAYAVAVPGPHSRTHAFSGARFVAEGLTDPRLTALFND